MLINREYFKGELYIEGAAASNNIAGATASLIGMQIDRIIETREKEYLQELLGCLYEPFMSWYEQYESASEEAETSEYKNLYDMLVDISGSPIAYYVYFFYVRTKNSMSTANGTIKKSVNNVSPMDKLVLAWNTMADLTRKIDKYILTNDDFYKGYKPNFHLLKYINSMGV